MKKSTIISVIFLLSILFVNGQSTLPDVTIRDLQGKQIQTSTFQNDGKPIILSFWATWCKPCVREFNTLNDVYEDWQDEFGVKIIAVSVDDARTSNNVAPFVNAKAWDFDFYIDVNHDFKRAMNVNLVPHLFILNGDGEVVWQHSSFSEGSELEIEKILKEIAIKTEKQ